MKTFELLEPESIEESLRMLSQWGDEAKVFAGGTALVKLMKKRLVHPLYLVNIKRIHDLQFIREDEEGIRIGALATLREVETSPLVRTLCPPVAEMLHTVGSVQIRNVGTLAGNLCLADLASDPAPLLIAMGASLKIEGLPGERDLPLEKFITDFYTTDLGPAEILTQIRIPAVPQNTGVVYLKHTLRAAFDLAVVGVAVRLRLSPQDSVCRDIGIVLGGVAAAPLRLPEVEDFIKGKRVDDPRIKRAAEMAAAGVEPIQDVRASAEYRKEMIAVFVERGIQQALARAQERREL
jgi:CO/xanthine dehydrogenase FAD-binding subunit